MILKVFIVLFVLLAIVNCQGTAGGNGGKETGSSGKEGDNSKSAEGQQGGGQEGGQTQDGGAESNNTKSQGGDSNGKDQSGAGQGGESGGNNEEGKVEEICGKGQGDTRPETPEEKKEEAEAEENKDDKKEKKFFFSGDMRVTKEQKDELERYFQTGQKREATSRPNAKWPNQTVYYTYHSNLGKKARDAIDAAIRDIEEYTCLTFVKRVDRSIEQYITFVKQNGCWSYVGMLSKPQLRMGYKQEVSIGEGCEYKGTAIHEIFHALGFEHEQSRPDRDKYVKINFQNIDKDKVNNFKKIKNSINLGVGYDYNSIMHYPDWAFSNNKKPTIEAIGDAIGAEIGQRDGMTAGDIEQVKKYYECDKASGSGKEATFTQILRREFKNETQGKKPDDKKGGKCEMQFKDEEKNKERKRARKEMLMRMQEENMKKLNEEEDKKYLKMLKKRTYKSNH